MRLTPTPTVVAAIDVGASAMRLIVAQHLPGQRPQVLEEASRGVLLGRDTFSAGASVRRPSTRPCGAERVPPR